MARGQRKYSTAIGILDDEPKQPEPKKEEKVKEEKSRPVKKQGKVQEKPKQVKKEVKVESVSNNETYTEDVNIESKHNSETTSLDDLSKSISQMFEEKTKKKTMEETHTRATFLIENKLLEKFNKITKDKRGYKTMLMNQVLQAVVDAHEKK
jgi:outer membrane biosynthesis protein TonB